MQKFEVPEIIDKIVESYKVQLWTINIVAMMHNSIIEAVFKIPEIFNERKEFRFTVKLSKIPGEIDVQPLNFFTLLLILGGVFVEPKLVNYKKLLVFKGRYFLSVGGIPGEIRQEEIYEL